MSDIVESVITAIHEAKSQDRSATKGDIALAAIKATVQTLKENCDLQGKLPAVEAYLSRAKGTDGKASVNPVALHAAILAYLDSQVPTDEA